MTAAYTGPYQINPKELPSNQNAAALVPAAIVDSAGTTWASSPMQSTGGAVSNSFADVPPTGTVSRTSCATASLAVEQSRLQGRNDVLSRNITLIQAVP
jgi:hypothetical protein